MRLLHRSTDFVLVSAARTSPCRLGRLRPPAQVRDPLLEGILGEITEVLFQHAPLLGHRPSRVLAQLVATLRVREIRGARGSQQILQLGLGRLELRAGHVARRADRDREGCDVRKGELE